MDNQDKTKLDNTSILIENQSAQTSRSAVWIYEFHVKGHLNSRWSDWLDNLEMKLLDNGEMILFGPIIDQAALLGILIKLNRLNLSILSVNEVIKEK